MFHGLWTASTLIVPMVMGLVVAILIPSAPESDRLCLGCALSVRARPRTVPGCETLASSAGYLDVGWLCSYVAVVPVVLPNRLLLDGPRPFLYHRPLDYHTDVIERIAMTKQVA